jgi:hypothetical protein
MESWMAGSVAGHGAKRTKIKTAPDHSGAVFVSLLYFVIARLVRAIHTVGVLWMARIKRAMTVVGVVQIFVR